MFELTNKPTPAPPTNDVIVPAGVNGYALLSFPTKPLGKMNIDRVNEIVQANLLPVVCWRLRGDKVEPLTIAPPDDASSRYLVMPNSKIFDLKDPAQRWNTYDQFAQFLLQQWRLAKQLPAVDPPPTSYVVDPAAVPALISTTGFFS